MSLIPCTHVARTHFSYKFRLGGGFFHPDFWRWGHVCHCLVVFFSWLKTFSSRTLIQVSRIPRTLSCFLKCTGINLSLCHATVSGKKSGETFSSLSPEWGGKPGCHIPNTTGISVTSYLCSVPVQTRSEPWCFCTPCSVQPQLATFQGSSLALTYKLFFDIVRQPLKFTVLGHGFMRLKKTFQDFYLISDKDGVLKD